VNKQAKQELIEDIDRLVKKYFFIAYKKEYFRHSLLCNLFAHEGPYQFWMRFWSKINTENQYTIRAYSPSFNKEQVSLLRLLIVEDFKQWIREL
jgi:hypothetical protein